MTMALNRQPAKRYDRFGKLTIVAISQKASGARVFCKCDCGNDCSFEAGEVLGHRRKYAACNVNGCRQVILKHGCKRSGGGDSEYTAWVSMKRRCYAPSISNYHCYGGRGIKVCGRWRNSFEAFLADMGRKPSPRHTLERRNVNGDYCPDNCCWALMAAQQRNRRDNRFITIDGETLCVAEWAERKGVNPDFIHCRLSRGWCGEKAVLAPKHNRGNHGH